MVMEETNNRMEAKGPNRKSLREMLNDDRKIVAHIFMTCCITVLERDYGWTEEEVREFHDYLQAEIKSFKG